MTSEPTRHRPKGDINNAVEIDIPGWDLVTAQKIPQLRETAGSIRFDVTKEQDPYNKAICRNIYIGKSGFEGLAERPELVQEVLVLVLVPEGKYARTEAGK